MRNPLIIFVTVAAFLLVSCGNQTIPTGVSTNATTETWQCGLIQANIDDLDISGTWRAEYNAYATETLFINQNGLYSQHYSESASGYQYESEPNSWYLEEVPGGGIYVHFEDMLDCGSLDRCVNPSNNELGFYDFCGDRWFSFEHEFVLSLVGDSRNSRGFWLRRMRPAGCEGCFVEYYSVEK
jgi:hypothetical protein